MTHDELLGVLATLGTEEAQWVTSVRTVAEACLLEFLATEGYEDVVQAYLTLLQALEDSEVPGQA